MLQRAPLPSRTLSELRWLRAEWTSVIPKEDPDRRCRTAGQIALNYPSRAALRLLYYIICTLSFPFVLLNLAGHRSQRDVL